MRVFWGDLAAPARASVGTVGGQQPAAERALAKFAGGFSRSIVVGVLCFVEGAQRSLVIFCWLLPNMHVENFFFFLLYF